MFKWRTVKFIILGALVAGASTFALKTPGWNAALATAGYYKYGGTTFWRQGLTPNQWVNREGFGNQGAMLIPAKELAPIAGENFCKGKGKALNTVTSTDYQNIDVLCEGDSTATVLTPLPNNKTYLKQWLNSGKNYGPFAIDKPLYLLTAKTFCESINQIQSPTQTQFLRKFTDARGVTYYHLDVQCWPK